MRRSMADIFSRLGDRAMKFVRHRRVYVLAGVLLTLGAGGAWAEPYWVAYEANDYPENEGWWRIWYGQPAQRSLEHGLMTLDTTSDPLNAEYYAWDQPEGIDPGSGEEFVLQWRVCVDEVTDWTDPAVVVESDESWVVPLRMGRDFIGDGWDVTVGFEPGVFHEFELRSPDMRQYDLYLDGTLVAQSLFRSLTGQSRVSWGAGGYGVSSSTRWDYVRFGVVPEPVAGIALAVLALLGGNVRRSNLRGDL